MQHQHGVRDCRIFVAAVCIALVTSQSSHMKWDPLMRLIYQSVWFITTYVTIFPTLNTGNESILNVRNRKKLCFGLVSNYARRLSKDMI